MTTDSMMPRRSNGIVAYPDVDTPAVLVDLDVLEANLRDMAGRMQSAGVRLRPHTKTHKSTWIARRQLDFGASGVTVAKLGEAEIMVDAGMSDLLVAYPIVGDAKLARLADLVDRASVIVSLDSVAVAEGIGSVGQRLGVRMPVYVEVDSGLHRCGLLPGRNAADLALAVAAVPGVEVRGLMTHAGHGLKARDLRELRQFAMDEANSLVQTARLARRRGLEIQELSIGSTPTAYFIVDVARAYPEITECRPGTYVFYDVNQMTVGVATEANCALTILTTVVSHPAPGRVVVDAGSKTVGGEVGLTPGFGRVKGDPSAYVARLSEEHGVVEVPPETSLRIGDRIELIPNHVCQVPNLANELLAVRDGRVDGRIAVEGRGRSS